jgi:hypothetical protein
MISRTCTKSGAAGERVVGAGVVVADRVRHRTHERDVMHLPREERQVLAHLEPGNARRDRAKLAPVLERRLGLPVPEVLVRRPSLHEKEDAGFRARSRRGPRDLAAKECRQGKPDETESADLQQAAARGRPVPERHEQPPPMRLLHRPAPNKSGDANASTRDRGARYRVLPRNASRNRVSSSA